MAIDSAFRATAINDGGSRTTAGALVYDPSTGSWVASSASSQDGQSSSSSTGSSPSSSNTQVNSQKSADKEYIEIEFNTLTGEITLTPTEKSIRIKVNDTVQLEGLGNYLSGLYFVSAIKRTLNKDNGYSHSMTLMKNGFGGSLKKSQETVETRAEEVPKTSPEVTQGDSIRIVGDNAVYSNAHDGVKVPAWVKQKTLTIAKMSDDGTRALVQPINSWVYMKYVQKV